MNIRKRMIIKAFYIRGIKEKRLRKWLWNNFDQFMLHYW